MPESQLAIVRQAERLAANLDGGSVKVGKNVLLALVADFVSTPHPDRDQLRRLLQLVQAGSGGHASRGGGYGDQLRLAAQVVAGVLDDDFSDQDLKSLFGWTARLLRNRQDETPETQREARPAETRGPKPQTPPTKVQKKPQERLGSWDAKSRSALEQIKQQLEDKEKGGKK
ncbi:MAG TPA: hypothetical protein VH988_34275 [Thermoanaerobaculia bacterium]|jgi:hypothetical protein|nr:hypothetical protein [Thermoanaerobaculia bacterium]